MDVDLGQLKRKIHEQGRRVMDDPSGRCSQGHPVLTAVLDQVKTTAGELERATSQVQAGEPATSSQSMRGRLGSLVKRRLYRLLWWQTHRIATLARSVARNGQAVSDALAALTDSVQKVSTIAHDGEHDLGQQRQQIQELENRISQLEGAHLKLQATEIERNVKIASQLESTLAAFREQIKTEFTRQLEAAGSELKQATTRISDLMAQETAQRQQLSCRLSELGLFAHQTRASVSLQERRLALFIEEARKRLPEPLPAEQLRGLVTTYEEHRYDSAYVAFEDIFRGTREEVKSRQTVYLPLLQESDAGSLERPILDLGCGRGEWLELLREHKLCSKGLDRNERMVQYCSSLGLDVSQGEVLSYLQTLPDSSFGAVTSFHLIEHLPFDSTLALLDEILRILKPGGLLILETPNPRNIQVGAYAFHFDPTHVKPLPSPMLRFFVEARGFCDLRVLDLHPYPEAVRFPADESGMASRLNDLLYGPQDYAVIGRKP